MTLNNISASHFYEEIKYNLNIMEKTSRDSNLVKELDPGFLEIFNNDLRSLKEMRGYKPQWANSIETKIQEIGSRMVDASPHMMDRIMQCQVTVPLISPSVPFETVVNSDLHPETNEKLREVGKHYDFIRIRGDGHCFFRAVAFMLLDVAPKKIESVLNRLWPEENISKQIPDYAVIVRDSLKKSEGLTAMQTMSNQKTSDAFVAFVRSVSCDWIKKNLHELPNLEIEAQQEGLSTERYLEEMASMEKKKCAGAPEIYALEKIFDMKPVILDLNVRQSQRESIKPHSEMGSDMPYALLHKGMHYDLAVAKPQKATVSDQ